MAGTRDQTARIVPADDEAAELRPAARRVPQDDVAPHVPPPAGDEPLTPEDIAALSGKPKQGRRKLIGLGVGAVLALAAAGFGVNYLLVGRFVVSTDDAYVRANNTMLGAKVAGHVAAIVPGDNAQVRAGDVLFRIDDGDYRIAVDAARAKIATQQATIARIGRQVIAQQSAAEQAKAQVVSAEAAANRAALDFDRQQALSTKGFASRATFEVSQAGRDQGAAAVQAAQAAYNASRDNVEVTKAQQAEARAQLEELKASLAKAERDLDFAAVRAPIDGIFANRLVNAGDYVQAGQRLANIVPLDGVYIDANFKETQLRRIKPGQPVAISVDAYSGRSIEGTVESLSPAAGAVFTLLPPDNATGNFTKIVQRVPVRVKVPADVARENLLRAGMSVYVSVNTKN
uniref:Secretion protein HlyD family protein n=1 Tax=Rhodopseudomonas palustris (strain BisA53) TaxID=316055 RepID=Q07PU8_RHOP5